MEQTPRPKRVFISYNYIERKEVGDLRAFFAPVGPIQAEPVTLDEDVSAGGDKAIEARVRALVAECAGVLVLVGGVSHNRRWSEFEVAVARRCGIPVVGVRHGNGRGAPPNQHPWLSFLDWDPVRIAAHLADWRPRPGLRWQRLDDVPAGADILQRARVRGGWLVYSLVAESGGLAYVPDPDHEW